MTAANSTIDLASYFTRSIDALVQTYKQYTKYEEQLEGLKEIVRERGPDTYDHPEATIRVTGGCKGGEIKSHKLVVYADVFEDLDDDMKAKLFEIGLLGLEPQYTRETKPSVKITLKK